MIQKAPWNALLIQIAAFATLVASVVVLWRYNLALCIVVLMETMVALVSWHDRYDISFLLVIGVLGSLAEAVFVHFGIWHYANPAFLGMPPWFPFAFGTTGLIGERLARSVADIWERSVSSPTPED